MARRTKKKSKLDQIINGINRLNVDNLFMAIFAFAMGSLFAVMILGLILTFFQ